MRCGETIVLRMLAAAGSLETRRLLQPDTHASPATPIIMPARKFVLLQSSLRCAPPCTGRQQLLTRVHDHWLDYTTVCRRVFRSRNVNPPLPPPPIMLCPHTHTARCSSCTAEFLTQQSPNKKHSSGIDHPSDTRALSKAASEKKAAAEEHVGIPSASEQHPFRQHRAVRDHRRRQCRRC